MVRKCWKWGFAVAASLIGVASVMAQEPGAPNQPMSELAHLPIGILLALVYSVVGIVILVVGFKILDLVTPFDLNKEISEDNNVAAGVLVAGMMIGLGIIIAAAIS